MSPFPSPEITPALDERRPEIGPNLAGNEALCRAVAKHLYDDRFYPYQMQQQHMWETWERIDDAFRVKGKRVDLDISTIDPITKVTNPDGRAQGITAKDGVSAKVYPAAAHKQIRNKTDMHMSVGWANGLPVMAKLPKTTYEHPLYNPDAQSVAAVNELLAQCADAVDMKSLDREVRGSWAKYGHAWVAVNFKYRLVDTPCYYTIPTDPWGNVDLQKASLLVQLVSAQFGGQQPQQAMQGGKPCLAWWKRGVDPDSMVTSFMPLRMDAVFIDQSISARDMNRQPCPIVRSHIISEELWGNEYDPELNPFGWLNTRRANVEAAQHYSLSSQDEGNLRREMLKKNGMAEDTQIRARFQRKQLWTFYPLLGIDPDTGLLDTGEGFDCPTCRGRKEVEQQVVIPPEAPTQFSTIAGAEGMATVPVSAGVAATRVPCPECQGVGKKFIKPERYVVQMFGTLTFGASSATVLRIQRNPTVKDKVPLIFGAHMTEDTAGAIPISCSEAALPACDQLATLHNQFLNAKNQIIDRPWTIQQEEPAMKMDCNRPNRNIPWDVHKPEPAQSVAFDVTATLPNFINMQEGEVESVHGLPPVLMGQISSGRRAATEIQTAADSANLPITVEIDSCHAQIHGPWAQFHIDNIEKFADRDWIQHRTGKTNFKRIQLHTAVAKDFFTQQAQMQLLQNFLPVMANIPGANVTRAAQEILSLAGINGANEFFDDGGVRKAQLDAFQIIAKVLGEGTVSMPNPWDPHEIYIQCFQQAAMDPNWKRLAPENIPLLEQLMMIHQQMLEQQQMQQMAQQIQQQAMLAQASEPPGQANATKGNAIPKNRTQAKQAQAGRDHPQ